jgi:hypothetical protein
MILNLVCRLQEWCEKYKFTSWIFWTFILPVDIFRYKMYIEYFESAKAKEIRIKEVNEHLARVFAEVEMKLE